MRLRTKIDHGLAAHLKALVKGVGLYGDLDETVVYLLRCGIIDHLKSQVFKEAMLPHLPKKIRKAMTAPFRR